MTHPGEPDPYQELPGAAPSTGPVPPPGTPPPQPGLPQDVYPPGVYPPGAHPPAYPAAATYPEASQAVGAIVVSALSLAVCGLLGPVGWQMGKKERQAIEAGRRDPANQGLARAAEIIGIVSTVILLAAVAFFVLFIGLALFGAAASAA